MSYLTKSEILKMTNFLPFLEVIIGDLSTSTPIVKNPLIWFYTYCLFLTSFLSILSISTNSLVPTLALISSSVKILDCALNNIPELASLRFATVFSRCYSLAANFSWAILASFSSIFLFMALISSFFYSANLSASTPSQSMSSSSKLSSSSDCASSESAETGCYSSSEATGFYSDIFSSFDGFSDYFSF